jgi:hypothetical protein
MKILLSALMLLSSVSVFAAKIENTKENQVNIARVVKLINLVDKTDIKVNIAVQDLGGSTDVSPTQKVFLTLYSKGEMFSTDAAFDLGSVISVIGAKRVGAGVYNLAIVNADMNKQTLTIDASEAIVAIKKVNCGDEFDCDASTNFSASIKVK